MKYIYIIVLFFFIYTFVSAQIPISTIEELQKIGNDPSYPLNGDYYLTNDIDASQTLSWNNGKGFEPLGQRFSNNFTGKLDGKEFTIYNLYISREDENWVGIFRACFNSEIKNLKIINIIVNGYYFVGSISGFGCNTINCTVKGEIYGKYDVGGIYGENGNLINCSFIGKVHGKSGNIGGLIGAYGLINDSYTSCTVIGDSYVGGLTGRNELGDLINKSYSTGKVFGNNNVGGLIGENNGSVIDCFSNCTVMGKGSYIGGLVGINYLYIENCYATGPVTGTDVVGGLVGISTIQTYRLPPEVIHSYYDIETTGQYDPGSFVMGYPKTTAEMMTPSTFTNWDFENVWFMVPGKSYPVLRPERYVGVKITTSPGTPNPKPSLPVEFNISFEETVRNFTFDDLDFSSSTLQGINGTLKIKDAPTTVGIMDCFTTWTLTITDSATTYGLIVVRVPLASAMNAANYPSAASESSGIYILSEHLPGDLNGDGIVNSEDRDILISLILNPLNGWKGIIPFPWYDLNHDDKLDIADVVTMIKNILH